ncbi:transglycosylase SLT domain-containing protein [Thauera sinica]|uniref:Transglycosylase SLT domain-containing protein n=1 Tax=Thauera sinica TaxID=2665146 RepID=A0ABW1ATS1_9RHOO|nr:transglycosylase SLT domain-containing protein [Thauera sp. K11]ATE59956.1 lytic transglycosylase [Thauera sp. K11]
MARRSTLRRFAALLLSFALAAIIHASPASAREAADGDAAPAPADALANTPAPRVLTLDLTRDANDIWDRIRRGFGMPDLDSPLVAEQQLFYLNRPAFLKQVFARGGRYLYYIVDELERRGMPTELALLPMVESSYNPLAYSRAHASGLWQFIPSTGKHYNLTQDHWVDERRNVITSTNAALDYLQTIYEMHGDWHLALASYNWGEGAVKRALQRNIDDGRPAEYQHLRMPDETRNYVPKLQAIKNIVSQPELFHIELPYVANEMQFVTVDAPPGIDLGTAARHADMPLDEFLALNPGFNRPAITTPGHTFVVPADRASRFEARLAETLRSGSAWRTHTVEPGERLDAIAEQYGLTVAQLRQLNGLGSQGGVGAGHALLVPDGIDPAGALEASRLLPFAGAAVRQQGLKLGSAAESGGSSGRDPQLRFNASKASPIGLSSARTTTRIEAGKPGRGARAGKAANKAQDRQAAGRKPAGSRVERSGSGAKKASGTRAAAPKAGAPRPAARNDAASRTGSAPAKGKATPAATKGKPARPAR